MMKEGIPVAEWEEGESSISYESHKKEPVDAQERGKEVETETLEKGKKGASTHETGKCF